MTSEIVKKAQYGIRDGQNVSLSLEKMVQYDVRDGQNGSILVREGQEGSL